MRLYKWILRFLAKAQYDKQTLVVLSVAKNPKILRHTLNLRRKIYALNTQIRTLNLWILRFAQYDKEFVIARICKA